MPKKSGYELQIKEKMEILLQVTSSRLKFITNYDKLIANYDSFAYYKIRRLVVTNWDSFFLYKLRQRSHKLRRA